ncbi:unnamed protein product [Arctogadus glacialis]
MIDMPVGSRGPAHPSWAGEGAAACCCFRHHCLVVYKPGAGGGDGSVFHWTVFFGFLSVQNQPFEDSQRSSLRASHSTMTGLKLWGGWLLF